MVRRLWLFGLILGVPVVGVLVATGVQWKFDSELRTAARRQVPDASPARLAALTFVDVCKSANADIQGACDTYAHVTAVGIASVAAASIGLILIAALWMAGLLARTSRKVLLFVFRPGLYFTGAVLILLVLMHAGIAIASIYYGESALVNRIHVGIILAITLGAIGGALAIARHAFAVVHKASVAVIGRSVTREQAPRLWNRVNEVAQRLDALPPEHIIVGLDPNFFVTEAEVQYPGGTCNGRTLYCSLPLSRILRTEEFIGIIGHELGHFKGEDTKFSQQFFPIYRGTVNSIAALQHSGGQGSGVIALLPAIALFSYFLECFSVAESKISRDRELIADRAGVEVSSVHAMATALVKVHAFAGIWEQVQNGAASLLSQGKGWLNASKTFAGAVVRAARPEALENVATTEMPHPTDSHPPLSVRLQALGLPLASLVQDALVVEPADAAINLVDEPEKIEQEVNDTYHSILRKYLPGQVEQGQPEATS